MRQVELHHGARSDVGLVREVNEDAYLASPPVFVVADGMGGHDGGEVASRIVIEEFSRLADDGFDPARGGNLVAHALRESQRRISAYGEEQFADGPVRGYAGTTVAAALLVDDGGPRWLLVNLGDSRIYRLKDERLEQVSVDHSVVQELVDAGAITSEDAATHPERHVITRALGGPERADPDYFLLPLPAVERLLLCSDGVSGMIDDDAIAAVLRDTEDPRDAADQLVERALAAGGRDNATAVVIDVVGWSDATDYDSDRQRLSLEQKLGALP
ncbi:PP2C family protein-serine/threonine phosphatase [Nocardioides sp.]|uniref:PP2C family protein-serine/threonine phosphatase n=1 Tax=Nocardioides sp. TaxID=35761 RepID=UPI002ED186D4